MYDREWPLPIASSETPAAWLQYGCHTHCLAPECEHQSACVAGWLLACQIIRPVSKKSRDSMADKGALLVFGAPLTTSSASKRFATSRSSVRRLRGVFFQFRAQSRNGGGMANWVVCVPIGHRVQKVRLARGRGWLFELLGEGMFRLQTGDTGRSHACPGPRRCARTSARQAVGLGEKRPPLKDRALR